MQTLGFVISIVSATHAPLALEAAASAFLADFVASLEAMTASEFSRHVEAAVANRLQESRSIHEEAMRLFAEVESRQYVFDRADREAAALRATEQQPLAVWAREALLGASARRLSVHVHKGSEHADLDVATCPLPAGASRLRDARAFKADLPTAAAPELPLPPVACDAAAI